MLKYGQFEIHVLPRVAWTWEEFMANTPHDSIALDGMVRSGPSFDESSCRINFDHHDGVVREATMSTSMQVYMAIKGDLMSLFAGRTVHVYINDTDQDTCHAVWFLLHHADFAGDKSIPYVSRHLYINDKLDITGGAFPISLTDKLIRQHVWVFEPYTNLRKSGALATADAMLLEANLEANLHRLEQFLMNQGGESEPDTRYVIRAKYPAYWFTEETGGSEARWQLFNEGMKAFVSVVATRPDGRRVLSIGRFSRYTRFPVRGLYNDLNALENMPPGEGWGGSDIVGGSSRLHGSGLSDDAIHEVILKRLAI